MISNPDASARLRPLPPPAPADRRAPRAQAPAPLTPLVGREREATLAAALVCRPDIRLLTLTGPGGVGKTRLSVEIAAELAERSAFADGVCFVPLAAVTDAELVAPTIARALGLTGAGDILVRDTLVAALRDAEMLLLLDNFEHVVAAAPLLTDLLTACPRLKILATSRALLRVTGEATLPIPPLELPDPEAVPSLTHVTRSAAVRLFVSRAQAVVPTIELTAASAPLIADICRRLDGLPLAIELAAARANILPLPALRDRLEQRLPLLTGGTRDAPRRHQTMRDAIAWSYDLLSAAEQDLFRRVSVFVGGFGLDAAEYVGGKGAEWPPAVFDGLASLVDRSLVRQDPLEGEARFSLLETIREFALEQLTASGDEGAVRGDHAGWSLRLAEEISLSILLPGGERALRRLRIEHANMRTALEWLDCQGEHDRLLRLAAALSRFWFADGHVGEGRRWLERALAGPRSATHPARARALVDLGQFLYIQGERERGEALVGESVAALREQADDVTLADALVFTAWIAIERGDHDRAEAVLEEALGLAAAIPDPAVAAWATGLVRSNLGVVAHERGDLAAARAWYEATLCICRAHGGILTVIRSLRDLGDVARDQGDHTGAVAAYRECLTLLGDRWDPRVVNALAGSALAAAAWGQPVRAARLLGAAEVARERSGVKVDMPADRAAHERAVSLVRATLGDAALQAAWSAGRALSLAAAIAEVRALEPPAADSAGDHPDSTLSPRQVEILRFLAAGKTDPQIAALLFISVRTVERHVGAILARLGAPTRTAAVVAAIAAGLVPSPDAAPPALPR